MWYLKKPRIKWRNRVLYVYLCRLSYHLISDNTQHDLWQHNQINIFGNQRQAVQAKIKSYMKQVLLMKNIEFQWCIKHYNKEMIKKDFIWIIRSNKERKLIKLGNSELQKTLLTPYWACVFEQWNVLSRKRIVMSACRCQYW